MDGSCCSPRQLPLTEALDLPRDSGPSPKRDSQSLNCSTVSRSSTLLIVVITFPTNIMADIWSSVPAPADSDTAEKVETTPIGKRDESEVQNVEETNPPPSSAVQTETKQKDQQETKAQTQEDATPSSAIEADQSPDVVKVPSATTATAGETETSSPASSAPTTPNSTKPKLNPSAQPFTAPKQPRGDRRTSSGRGSAPGSPAVSSAAGSKRGGSVSVGGSQRGGANMANSSPRMRAGYVPPEIVKPVS